MRTLRVVWRQEWFTHKLDNVVQNVASAADTPAHRKTDTSSENPEIVPSSQCPPFSVKDPSAAIASPASNTFLGRNHECTSSIDVGGGSLGHAAVRRLDHGLEQHTSDWSGFDRDSLKQMVFDVTMSGLMRHSQKAIFPHERL